MSQLGPKPELLFTARTSASAGCGHLVGVGDPWIMLAHLA
jgi:hypothetical protein